MGLMRYRVSYLYEEIEMTSVLVTACRCVTPDDLFSVNLCSERNVLTDGEAKEVIWTG
jgi:hypothetical protein